MMYPTVTPIAPVASASPARADGDDAQPAHLFAATLAGLTAEPEPSAATRSTTEPTQSGFAKVPAAEHLPAPTSEPGPKGLLTELARSVDANPAPPEQVSVASDEQAPLVFEGQASLVSDGQLRATSNARAPIALLPAASEEALAAEFVEEGGESEDAGFAWVDGAGGEPAEIAPIKKLTEVPPAEAEPEDIGPGALSIGEHVAEPMEKAPTLEFVKKTLTPEFVEKVPMSEFVEGDVAASSSVQEGSRGRGQEGLVFLTDAANAPLADAANAPPPMAEGIAWARVDDEDAARPQAEQSFASEAPSAAVKAPTSEGENAAPFWIKRSLAPATFEAPSVAQAPVSVEQAPALAAPTVPIFASPVGNSSVFEAAPLFGPPRSGTPAELPPFQLPLEIRPVEAPQVTWKAASSAQPSPTSDAQESSLWALWNARQLSSAEPPPIQATAVKPNAGGEGQGTQPAEITAGVVAPEVVLTEGGGGGDLGSRSSEERGDARVAPQTLERSGEKFEVVGGNVDVKVAPAASSSYQVQSAKRAIMSTIRGGAPQASGLEAGSNEARIELNVDGENIVIHVRVKGGVVDVDIAGINADDLSRLREELKEQLPDGGFDLGDLREGNDRGAEEREAEEREAEERLEPEEEVDRLAQEPTLRREGIWIKA